LRRGKRPALEKPCRLFQAADPVPRAFRSSIIERQCTNVSVVLTDFAEIDYSDAASCQNLDAVEPSLELAIAQAWNEFIDPNIVNSGGIKDYLDKSGSLLQRSVAAPRNVSHPQSKRNKVRKSGNDVPFVV
jgi:hypothetical protein